MCAYFLLSLVIFLYPLPHIPTYLLHSLVIFLYHPPNILLISFFHLLYSCISSSSLACLSSSSSVIFLYPFPNMSTFYFLTLVTFPYPIPHMLAYFFLPLVTFPDPLLHMLTYFLFPPAIFQYPQISAYLLISPVIFSTSSEHMYMYTFYSTMNFRYIMSISTVIFSIKQSLFAWTKYL